MRGVQMAHATRCNFSSALKKKFINVNDASFKKEDLLLFNEIISEQEANILIHSFKSRLDRRKYQGSHWDRVITNYREIEVFGKFVNI